MPFAFSNTPQNGTATVTTAGTPVQLSATTLKVTSVLIIPKKTNTGATYAGTNSGAGTQHAITPLSWRAKDTECLDLSQIWIDAAVSGEGVAWEADNEAYVSFGAGSESGTAITAVGSTIVTTSLPTGIVDKAITGQGSQTALNQNIINAVAGAGATPASGYRNLSIQVNVSAGTVTAGVVTFEGSNDNANFFALYLSDYNAANFNSSVSAITIVAATNRVFVGAIQYNFVRARISTGLTGTNTGIQAFTTLSTNPFLPAIPTVNIQQVGGSTIGSAGVAGTLGVGGLAAPGVAAGGNPVLVSGLTVNAIPAAALTAARVADIPITTDNQVIVHLHGSPENEWQASSGTTPLATNTSTAAKAAAGAGIRNYVTDIHVVNNSATVSTTFSILDGASVIWTTYLPATTAALPVVPVTKEFITPLKGTAATALNVQCGTTSASVFYNVSGYQHN